MTDQQNEIPAGESAASTAAWLGSSIHTVNRLRMDGYIPATKHPKRNMLLYDRAAVADALRKYPAHETVED